MTHNEHSAEKPIFAKGFLVARGSGLSAQGSCAVFVALLVLALSAVPALAHRGRVFGQSFGAPGSGAGQLSLTTFEIGGVPVGGSGLAANEVTHNVYVADTGNNRVDEFTSTGVFVRAWGWGVANGAPEFEICTEATGCRAGLSGTGPGEFESPAFVTVDDSPGGEEDVYVADYHYKPGGNQGDHLVQKFTPEGALVESWGSKGQIDETSVPPSVYFGTISGVAVDPSGGLLVGDESGIYKFAQSTGAYIERVGTQFLSTTFPNGFAADGSGNFYFEHSEQIIKYSAAGVEENKLFQTPFEARGLAVARSGELYFDEGKAIQVISSSCVSLCAPIVTFTSPLLAEGAGLAVDSQSGAVYIAETAVDKIESIVPEPPAAPLVEAGSQTVSDVSGDSATLEAVVNPRSEPAEEPTSYRFQYTTDENFQQEGFTGASSIPVPDGQLAPNYEAELVRARVQGLLPHTVYRYRVVAENAISRKEGKPTEGERNGAGEEVVRTFTTQTAGVFSLPDGRAWELVSPPDKIGALLLGFYFNAGVVQASADGSALTYLASAPTELGAPGNSNLTQVLSTRTGTDGDAWVSRDISTPREVANGLGGGQEYRFFSTDLSLSIVHPQGPFDPSLSSEASEQTSFLHTDYAQEDPGDPCLHSCYRPLATGAPGFANVPEGTEIDSKAPNSPDCAVTLCGPEFHGASPDGSHVVLNSQASLIEGAPPYSLYEWANGQLQLVSVLPEGEPAPEGSFPQLGVGEAVAESQEIKAGAVSADGSRIVWSTGVKAGRRLYVRDMTNEETVELGGAEAGLQAASRDDSRIFFEAKGELFVYEAPLGGQLSVGHTSDLTPGGGVIGTVLGASSDGSSIYFVANKVLTSTPSSRGEEAQVGEPNLYVENAGVIKLVAVLSSKDAPDWGSEGVGKMTTTRVSPDGRWLAFMSERSLTGYDNRDVVSGVPDEEVFLYDAAASRGTGGLVCASCDPTGARPHGLLDDREVNGKPRLVDEQVAWNRSPWLAANIPAWTSTLYQSRYLSDSGRLFFNSDDALVASDTNGTEDVYEYEPAGVGDCSSDSALFSPGSGGCVDLISSGVAKEESAFLDASESGDDVFFLTTAQLSSTDTDSVPDVYDARVDGGFPVPQAPPACEGDACQSPVAAPNDPTPGSLTYQGPGNPMPLLTPGKTTKKKASKCVRGKRLSHGRCVKSKSKKKVRKADRTAKGRRAGNKRGGRS